MGLCRLLHKFHLSTIVFHQVLLLVYQVCHQYDPDYDRSGYDRDYDRRVSSTGQKRDDGRSAARDPRSHGRGDGSRRDSRGNGTSARKSGPPARGPPWGPLPPNNLGAAFHGKPPTSLVDMARRWEKQLKAAINARRTVRAALQSGPAAAASSGKRIRGRGHVEGLNSGSDDDGGQGLVPLGSIPTPDDVATAVKQFRRALCAAYSAVMLKDATLARRHKLGHYLWVLYYHDIGEEKSRLKVCSCLHVPLFVRVPVPDHMPCAHPHLPTEVCAAPTGSLGMGAEGPTFPAVTAGGDALLCGACAAHVARVQHRCTSNRNFASRARNWRDAGRCNLHPSDAGVTW